MRPHATHSGKLFDGHLDCYVLDDKRRVVSQRGVVRALTGGGADDGKLGRYVDRLPNGSALLASGPEIEFTLPGGGVAKGREATFMADLCNAYVEALGSGSLHHTQVHLAVQAARILTAFAKVGIIALVDEATGYQAQREASALSFAYRAILLESEREWDLMWPPECVDALCRLHGKRYIGGAHPKFLASTYDRLYRAILGDAVVDELKRRNPMPQHGKNHHQWLTPEAREVVRRNINIVTILARQSMTKDEFWARIATQFCDEPLQMTLYVPKRRKPGNNNGDGEAAE